MDKRVGVVVVVKIITLGRLILQKSGPPPRALNNKGIQCHWPGDANELSGDESSMK
jgi:hypothetical protein